MRSGISLAVVVSLLVVGGATIGFAFASDLGSADGSMFAIATSLTSTVSVHSHAWAISTGPTTTTPAVSVPARSAAFVFVAYVNSLIGGGGISSISDTSHDSYHVVASTGFAKNHTEVLFVANDIRASAHLRVSVSFSGGATPQGGSVALIDVVGQSKTHAVDVVFKESGFGPQAAVGIVTNRTGDLFLLGVSGRQYDSPFAAGPHEHLIDTGGAIAGPFTDGIGFGTFSSAHRSGTFALSAMLNHPSYWNVIGVGILFQGSG
jgi:hypothetical protein